MALAGKAAGNVIWATCGGGGVEVGIRFLDSEAAFFVLLLSPYILRLPLLVVAILPFLRAAYIHIPFAIATLHRTSLFSFASAPIAAAFVSTLAHAFPICGLGVSVATDGTFCQTDVFAATHSPAFSSSSNPSSSHGHGTGSSFWSHGCSTSSSAYSHGSRRKEKDGKEATKRWGDRPVLLVLGIKLGIEGVNPVRYETIKPLYTFPQSVGIAGGCPSSSCYFVGAQGDGLFYLDPHHSRPSVPLRPFLGESLVSAHGRPSSSSTTSSRPSDRRSPSPEAYVRGGYMSPESGGAGAGHSPMTEDELILRPRSAAPDDADEPACHPAGGPLTPAEAFYARVLVG
ncbi:hypothetical protein C8F04DRAFT_1284659 [Mycena alexandri]|uniref:Cysteine protease n=1 Tax=Mycena alexandri TaxID=1745969 RepID=A0AAD6WKR5_9AGAR|nr:hypothetical protein C8F04DRAFT_1284659 [Mycena alexandri]